MKLIKGFLLGLVCLFSLPVLLLRPQNALAYETLRVNIPVNCLAVYGNSTHTYELRIRTENESSPEPVSDHLTVTEESTGAFEIDLTEPGTYYYSIYEAAGSDSSIQYDSSSYTVAVFAENNESDGLRCAITAYMAGTDSKTDEIAFQDLALSDTETTSETTETTAQTTASDTTTASETETTAATSKRDEGSLLTGDSFPAHAIRLVMLFSAMTAIFAFLFKRNQNEEEEKNE